MKTHGVFGVFLVAVILAAVSDGGGGSFDKLNEADRKVFRDRFEKEIWPLMTRNGKDGCIGCHNNPKTVTAMRLSGDAGKDYQFLLKEGFFLVNDEGSLYSRVTAKDAERRMPLGKKAWTAEEATVLKTFMADLDKKQQKKK